MEKIKNLTTKEYYNKITNKLVNYKEFLALAKNYKASNKNDSLTKYMQRIINDLDTNNKITNDTMQKINYIVNMFVLDLDEKNKINDTLNNNTLKLKQTLLYLYNYCKKFGVIVEKSDNTITYNVGLKTASPYAIFKYMLIMLIAQPHTYIKPPKKDKPKKTLKKSTNTK